MSAGYASLKVPLDVSGVTANTVGTSRSLLICAYEAVPHFQRGEAQVSDVKSVSPFTLPSPEIHAWTLVSMPGRPAPMVDSHGVPSWAAGQ